MEASVNTHSDRGEESSFSQQKGQGRGKERVLVGKHREGADQTLQWMQKFVGAGLRGHRVCIAPEIFTVCKGQNSDLTSEELGRHQLDQLIKVNIIGNDT